MLAPCVLIFRRRVAYNVGYCRSLYFQKMLRSPEYTSVKGENGELRAYAYAHYIMRSLCDMSYACTCVSRCSFGPRGCCRRLKPVKDSCEKKLIIPDTVPRICNTHNALFASPLNVSENVQIVYTRTFAAVKASLGLLSIRSLALFHKCSRDRE